MSKKFDYLVNISEAAFRSILLATIESYLGVSPSRGKGNPRSYLETYGLLWGYETILPDKRACFTIEAATTDVNADRSHNGVTPSKNGLDHMNAVVASYWPNWRFIGDFHSHPYKPNEEPPFTELSDLDRLDVEGEKSIYPALGYRVCLVTSIKKMQRQGWKDPGYVSNNVLEWTIHDLRMTLGAWVAEPRSRGKRLTLIPPERKAGRPLKTPGKSVWLHAPIHLIHQRLN